MNQKELAQALGVAPSLVTRYKQQGMPVDDVRAAVRWLDRNIRPRYKTPLDSIRAKSREAQKRGRAAEVENFPPFGKTRDLAAG